VSDKSDDFLSFEKALRELKMRSEELKKLVSEGEIRAFRDGDSMKFRSEDVEALRSKASGDAELSFADSLEDDTGMVTEQLSDEDTLLADDEVVEEKPAKRPAGRPARQAPVAVGAGAAKDPIWLTIAGILCTVVMLWGCMVSYNISQEKNPKDSPITSVFAEKAPK
jgi:hypothetical protein